MAGANFLAGVMAAQRRRMAEVPGEERDTTAQAAHARRIGQLAHTFRSQLSRCDRINVIAEIKRRSPSGGSLRPAMSVETVAQDYEAAGAAAISVLTESDHFGGSLDDLRRVTACVAIPALRKDFLMDSHQVHQAAAAGANAVLLIAAALDAATLAGLRQIAEESLGMDALVEVHDEAEMHKALDCGANLIGVNNRNLATLQVDLATSRALARYSSEKITLVSESGLRSAADLRELKHLGYNAFLIGEYLLRADDPAARLRALLKEAADA